MKRFRMAQVIVLLVLVSFGISGCIGFQPFPLAARSGDTIALGLGGTSKHEQVPGDQITLNDLDITIQQDINQNGVIDASEIFPVKKRYLFRLYPDLTSYAANFTEAYPNTPVGEWSAVVDLVDPFTNTPLQLAENSEATVVVTTDKLLDNSWWGFEGTLSNIPVYILPGIGESHNFNNNLSVGVDVANLEPLPQLSIGFSGSGNVAAVALDIVYDGTVLTNESYIRIKQDISKPGVTLISRVYTDNGSKKIRIFLMANQGTRKANVPKCFIVWDPAIIASGQSVADSTFNVTSAKFYDESGVEVTGISVVKTLLYQ